MKSTGTIIVKRLRSRIFAGLLFVLLSLGQAYPFSAAWAMAGKSHPCCCSSQIAKPCDCDHKGHGSPKKAKKFSCHEEKTPDGPYYAPTPCGAQTEAKSLNFRGEACLPHFASYAIVPIEVENVDDVRFFLPQVLAIPESPPPRFDLAG